jgi:hypothetical protein
MKYRNGSLRKNIDEHIIYSVATNEAFLPNNNVFPLLLILPLPSFALHSLATESEGLCKALGNCILSFSFYTPFKKV